LIGLSQNILKTEFLASKKFFAKTSAFCASNVAASFFKSSIVLVELVQFSGVFLFSQSFV
jgi:hypothetical protein